MDKLKPCPFCGGKPEILRDTSFNSHFRYKVWVWIKCPKCDIKTKAFDSYIMDWNPYTTEKDQEEAVKIPKAKVIEVWNKRSEN